MNFTQSDLLMSDRELELLTAALASAGQPDPVGQVIGEEAARVGLIAGPYELPEPWLMRLTRALVLFTLYTRTGQALPDQIKAAYDEAQKDLTDIREGKYQNLLRTDGVMASSANLPAYGNRPQPLGFTRAHQSGL